MSELPELTDKDFARAMKASQRRHILRENLETAA